MFSYFDLKNFFEDQDFQLIIAADAEPRVRVRALKEGVVLEKKAGGVAVALDPVAKASSAIYIARGRTREEEKLAKKKEKVTIEDPDGTYQLRRLFFPQEELDSYYIGFANQTLWPLCHVAFERPEFRRDWFAQFKLVNEKFAQAIKEEIKGVKDKPIIWVNDYQLCLVPKYIGRSKEATLAMFWHIPWPTWEIFRTLPFKKEILESLLTCDFLAFHRGYHVRNFLETVNRELGLRIDDETNKVYSDNHTTTVRNLPMGVDTENIKSLIEEESKTVVGELVKRFLIKRKKAHGIDELFEKQLVLLGVDRLDYTKGLLLRMQALDRFFEKYPAFSGKVTYLGILAPSREKVPAYIQLKKDLQKLAATVNSKYRKADWQPIRLVFQVFERKEVLRFYQKAKLCLVTPRDDGMNLVSKEFVVVAAKASDPGMLVLSTFAGSAIDLTQALIVNPYDIEALADAMKEALEMGKNERVRRMKDMAEVLDEHNVYEWARQFIEGAIDAGRGNR